MIYAGEQGPWRSWIQILSKNNKKAAKNCYKLGWNSDPSNIECADPHILRNPAIAAYPTGT
jgi:hypothetical protein